MNYLIVENDGNTSYISVNNIESFTHDVEQGTVLCTCTSGAQHILIKADRYSTGQYISKLVRKIKWEDITDIHIADFNKKYLK